MLKTDDIHPPKTGMYVHCSYSLAHTFLLIGSHRGEVPEVPTVPTPFLGHEIPTCDSEFCEGTSGTVGTGGNISHLMKILLPQGYNTCYYGDVTFATTRGSKIASSNESENSSATR